MLAVDPARHGRGVGRALTMACIERARADGRRRMVLHTGDWMPAAKHLYELLGFERDAVIDFSPAPGIELLGYALDLSGRRRPGRKLVGLGPSRPSWRSGRRPSVRSVQARRADSRPHRRSTGAEPRRHGAAAARPRPPTAATATASAPFMSERRRRSPQAAEAARQARCRSASSRQRPSCRRS